MEDMNRWESWYTYCPKPKNRSRFIASNLKCVGLFGSTTIKLWFHQKLHVTILVC